MKRLLLLVLLSTWICVSQSKLVCSNGFQLMPNGKCWMLVKQYKTYDDANDICRFTDGSFMVQLKDDTDNKQMVDFLANSGYSSVYLGMRWKLQWDDTTMLKNYSRLDTDCALECGVIYNNTCYTMMNKKIKTFDSAQSVCELYKSNLVSINAYDEFRFVASQFKQPGSYWIGGKMNSDLSINWIDGSKHEYDQGVVSNDGRCLQFNILANGIGSTYVGSDCQDEKMFMCKRPVVPCDN
ncbi:hypothetical protein B9Z55_005073 [Caenorhabditis nigoni]|uniref:C-type lectin domain-containing protein n=1 Tax=Caenorhabditis nigoni TaxID=1611254 RepID=A0A2G5UZA3_9PELO|nr:hypothetical protein B9Z55_005073 [Caenorhabditis nigoni]